ncbi:MAG: sulfite exporter TauE/SafE family protein, partial [Candidatus Daviesbacteria bacterium]|nr:sulfite exporter TauE/SafE family protein [Candidatus Daviesbacteria bacterium]
MDLLTIFFIGLTAGGFGCVALQGGLLASAITARKEVDREDKNDFLPTLAFLLAKLGVYALLGLILGFFGQAVSISDSLRITLQFVAGAYMIIVALSLLDVHPIFRHFIIQPPRFLTRLVKNQSKSADIFAPGILGAMTIFIPCGTTLAMEALAISSGSPVKGALILISFVLGTFPIFFGLGYITAKLSDSFRQTFFKIAALVIIIVGLSTIYTSWSATGLPTIVWDTGGSSQQTTSDVKQDHEIQIVSNGYSPNYIKVKKGLPVKLTLVSNNIYSCSLAFRIPSLGIGKNLKPTDSVVLEFTPTEVGQIPFSCSMGMYRGTIEVV